MQISHVSFIARCDNLIFHFYSQFKFEWVDARNLADEINGDESEDEIDEEVVQLNAETHCNFFTHI